MSSDVFDIEIRSVDGDTVELLCTTGTAGGLNDYALTRSFVLSVLEDALRGSKSKKPPPFLQALRAVGGATPPVWEEAFHKENVGKFIASTELLERIGIIEDEDAWNEGRHRHAEALRADRKFKGNIDAALDKEYPRHQFVLRARVTDPRWLEGLRVGQQFGTTSFDAWWDDPLRPKPKKTAAKKTAAKKTAAKKTAAKKR